MSQGSGKPLRLDPTAQSASTGLPAFLARPTDAPVYHGFTTVEESRADGWVFGTITDYEDANGCEYGDAFVIAPDGSRAGLVWQVDSFNVQEICPPNENRWGVYGVAFPKPVRTTEDFVEGCRCVLPALNRIHEELNAAG
jgi:hypothetical protein